MIYDSFPLLAIYIGLVPPVPKFIKHSPNSKFNVTRGLPFLLDQQIK